MPEWDTTGFCSWQVHAEDNVAVCCHVQLFAALSTVAPQTPLSMGFSRQEYWSGAISYSRGYLLTQGLNSCLLHLLHWQVDSLSLALPGKPAEYTSVCKYLVLPLLTHGRQLSVSSRLVRILWLLIILATEMWCVSYLVWDNGKSISAIPLMRQVRNWLFWLVQILMAEPLTNWVSEWLYKTKPSLHPHRPAQDIKCDAGKEINLCCIKMLKLWICCY